MSSFFGINIGRSAILAQQVGIETAGHNVANVNTEGYSRQKVIIDPMVSDNFYYGAQGAGVDVQQINRVHEVFLERQLSRVTTQKTYDTQLLQGLDELQSILNEPGNNSISSALTEFWNSWESLSMRPTDAGLRGQVIEAGNRVAREYNTRIAGFVNAEKGFNDEVKSLSSQANELISELASLNKAVTTAEGGGGNANDLRDQRDKLAMQISELIGVEPIEEGYNLNLRIADGGPYLVNGSEAFEVNAVQNLDGWVTGINIATRPLNVTTGRIGAYMELRDSITPDLRAEMASMMARVTDKVNALHESGYDGEMRAGLSFFTWTGGADMITTYPTSGIFDVTAGASLQAGTHYLSVVSVDQASGVPLAANTYGDISAGSIALTHSSGDFTGTPGLNLDYNVRILNANSVAGDLVGMRVQLFRGDEAVGSSVALAGGSNAENVTFTADGMTIDAAIDLGGAQYFVKGERSDGLSTTGYASMDGGAAIHVDHMGATEYTFVTGSDNGYLPGGAAKVTFEQKRGFTGASFTANSAKGILSVNSEVAIDIDRVAAALPRTDGDLPAAGDGELSRAIADVATVAIFELTGETVSGRLGSIVQGLGEQTRQAKIFEEADQSILTQLTGQKQSFSGVNMDEEMVLLLQFQRGFEASARFVTTADSMLDTIINRLGRVGL